MTKKDYELIAAKIRHQYLFDGNSEDSRAVLDALIDTLSGAMIRDNSRFNYKRFGAACRGEDSHDSAGRRVNYSRRTA